MFRRQNFVQNLSLIIILFFFLDDGKKAESPVLAPIETKILISRGSAYKIEVYSGTNAS